MTMLPACVASFKINSRMTETFPAKLKAVMERRSLSPYRLAKETGLSDTHIYNLTTGKRAPTDEVLAKLSPALGVELDELLDWADLDRLGEDGLRRLQRRGFKIDADTSVIHLVRSDGMPSVGDNDADKRRITDILYNRVPLPFHGTTALHDHQRRQLATA